MLVIIQTSLYHLVHTIAPCTAKATKLMTSREIALSVACIS